MSAVLPVPNFHPLIEVIDLTRSSDEELAQTLSPPIRVVWKTLPLRPISNTHRPQTPISQLSKKRARRDSPHPGFAYLHAKRPRSCLLPAYTCFLEGVLKPVRIFGHERPNDVTLPEVLQVDLLNEAVLSSFVWDADWLMGPMGLAAVDSTWVVNAGGTATSAQYQGKLAASLAPRRRLHFPAVPSRSCSVHGKLILLFRNDGYLRIAIPTGNLRRADWGAAPPSCGQLLPSTSCTLDNAVFIIDLPMLRSDEDAELQWEIAFRRELLSYVDHLGLSAQLKAQLYCYNFDGCRPYGFVHTR